MTKAKRRATKTDPLEQDIEAALRPRVPWRCTRRSSTTDTRAQSFRRVLHRLDRAVVNGMIRTLKRNALLSRVPGVARSLRVLAPTSLLPDSDFGSCARGTARGHEGAVVSPVDTGVAAAIAVLDVVIPNLSAGDRPSGLVLQAARAVQASLARAGLGREEAQDAARRVAAEAARWQADGRGIFVHRRQWMRR